MTNEMIILEPGDILIYQGTNFRDLWTIPWDIEGCSYKGIIRENNSAKTKVAELTITPDEENSEILLTLNPDITKTLNPELDYTFAVEQIDGAGEILPLAQGRCIVKYWEANES